MITTATYPRDTLVDAIYYFLSMSNSNVIYDDVEMFENDLIRLVRRSDYGTVAWNNLTEISEKMVRGIYVPDYWDRFLNNALVILRIVFLHRNFSLRICVRDGSRFIYSDDARYDQLDHMLVFDRTSCIFKPASSLS
jgi:hypothetical protein